jgi:hypothetical protein
MAGSKDDLKDRLSRYRQIKLSVSGLRSQHRPTSPCQLVSRSAQRLGGYPPRAEPFAGVEPLSS